MRKLKTLGLQQNGQTLETYEPWHVILVYHTVDTTQSEEIQVTTKGLSRYTTLIHQRMKNNDSS